MIIMTASRKSRRNRWFERKRDFRHLLFILFTALAAFPVPGVAGWVLDQSRVRSRASGGGLWQSGSNLNQNVLVANVTDSPIEQKSEMEGQGPFYQTATDRSESPYPEERSSSTMTTVSSLGDIMNSGLSTDSSPTESSMQQKTLAETYGITHPLDRMALTANGNLQRLVASYYDAPVTVLVEFCALRKTIQGKAQVWDRVVHLQVHGTTFCTATSIITVHDPLCQSLVESSQVGLGQLFRYLNILPEFELHDAGVEPAFWREYTLQCAELSCRIHEEFRPNMWEI